MTRSPVPLGLPDAVECVAGDLTEPASLVGPLTGIRTIVHLAALVAPPSGADHHLKAVNVRGTDALARAARTAGVARFIHVSSAGVYGEGSEAEPHRETDLPSPATPYEHSKLAAERALESVCSGSEISWSILRPTGVYGADRPATTAFFRSVARKRLWLHGPSRVLVHPTYVADLVGAIDQALCRGGLHREILNVGGERPLEFRELIRMVGARVGRRPLQLGAPAWGTTIARAAARCWRAPRRPPAALVRWSRPLVNRTVSIERARALLGFDPVALEWGLDTTAAELRRSGLL